MKLTTKDEMPIYVNSKHIMYLQKVQKGDSLFTQVKLSNGEQIIVCQKPWIIRLFSFIGL